MINIEYYSVENSLDDKKIGTNPQLINYGTGLTEEIGNYFNSLTKIEQLPDSVSHLDQLHLDDDAKVTDFLSSSFIPFGFIVSPKVKELLVPYRDETLKFYPAIIIHKKRAYNYFFLLKLKNVADIDFPESTFIKTNLLGTKIISELKVNSISELKQIAFYTLNTEHKAISFKEIVLRTKKDILAIPLKVDLFVSKELKEKLEAEKVSGITFEKPKISFLKSE